MPKIKQLPIVFIIPLFVGLVGFLLVFAQYKKTGTVAGISTSASAPVEVAPATDPMALIVREAGVVLYQLPHSKEYISLKENQLNVPTGTTVRTESTAFAHVIFPNNSLMSLDKDTEIVLNFEGDKIKIFQVLGSTWHRVQKVLQGNSYEVETPNTLATVRGTEFNVNVLANNESEVYVIDSVVEVAKIAQENGQVVTKEVQLVEKNEHVSVSAPNSEEPIKLITMPEEKKNTDWFKRNEKLTEEIEKAEEVETQKIIDQENSENLDSPTHSATTAPIDMESFIDAIQEKVIKEVMDSIQENTEMIKIDEEFGIDRSEPEEVSNNNNEDEQNEDSSAENIFVDVGGMVRTIENVIDSFTSNSESSESDSSPLVEPVISETTDSPFLEPTESSDSKDTSADTPSSQEEAQENTEEEKPSENPDEGREPELAEEQNNDNAPDQSAASSILERIDESLSDWFSE